MSIVTGVVSLAFPLKDGVVSFEGDFGWFNVTSGAAVFTVKATGALFPAGLPRELLCVATAVYWPLTSAGLALPDVQSPPVPVASALATGVPCALDPA
jgi:hypothetical protein